jgi:hypothetical protein
MGLHTRYQGESITILGDDLYAHEPFCREALARGYHFIFVAKPESHQALYTKAGQLGVMKEKVVTRTEGTSRQEKTVVTTYAYANGLPLHAGPKALLVGFVLVTEVTTATTVTKKQAVTTTKQTYHNGFVTDHPLTDDNVSLVATAGRTRWKIENENNNTLKTKGYNLEHNFGHGKENLATVLATMNIIAFLFHTMQEFMNDNYITLRAMIGSRKKFFEHMKILLIYECYDNLDDLLEWMIQGLQKRHPAGSRRPT